MKFFRHFGLAAVLLLAGCTSNSTGSSDTNSTTNTSVVVLSFGTPFQRSLDSGAGGATSGQITAVGDFNGDGRADFAVANPATNSISVFLNSGGGGFNAEVKFAGPLSGPKAIAVGDFNKDGALDIVAIGTNQASFLLNNGAGAFPTHVELPIGTDNRGVDAADFDGDGNLDAAICDAAGSPLHIVFGDGSSTVTNYVSQDFNAAAGTVLAPLSIVKGDFNQDGRIDVAVANQGSDFLTIWLNAIGSRAAMFPSGNTIITNLNLPAGNRAQALTVGDLNGDGRADLAAGSNSTTSATAQLFINVPQGIFNTSGQQPMSPNPRGSAIADFNQDGLADLVVVSANGLNSNGTGEADFFLGNGFGVLNVQFAVPVATGKLATSVSVADFNGDGRPDVVVAGPGQASVIINTSSKQ